MSNFTKDTELLNILLDGSVDLQDRSGSAQACSSLFIDLFNLYLSRTTIGACSYVCWQQMIGLKQRLGGTRSKDTLFSGTKRKG